MAESKWRRGQLCRESHGADTAERGYSYRLRWTTSFLLLIAALSVLPCSMSGAADVATYHYDNLRTGWNAAETVLTPRTIKHGSRGRTLKLVGSTALDDQVDAQPLLATSQSISGKGTHDVVYVATENNTLYAIDAASGEILVEKNFGPPVPEWNLPGGCSTNALNVGITGTPVVDRATSTLYFIAYTFTGSVQRYFLHAVDMSTLDDVVAPVEVAATGTLGNGHTYAFDASVSRQRAALLLANGNIYAAFASFCDVAADKSRGWLLGWQKDTLTSLARNALTDQLAKSPNDIFLTAIWMSGYGPAASPSTGSIYFVTGNSDPSGETFNRKRNIEESAVRMSPDLATIESLFTPDNAASLDQSDWDFGAGGFLLLPPQAGASSNFGVAAGKDGKMYFLNTDNLNNKSRSLLGTYDIGGCWCGETYYTADDGAGRVIGSGGNAVTVWKVLTSPKPHLKLLRSLSGDFGQQDPGFFTTVSSNGITARSAVVWAVSRPDDTSAHAVRLSAFNPSADSADALLFSAQAGTWPNTTGNANIVPVVANGRVYVASYQNISIFGLSSATAAVLSSSPTNPKRMVLPAGVHEIYGTVKSMNGHTLVLARRDGRTLPVDFTRATRGFSFAQPGPNRTARVRGTFNDTGVFDAEAILRAKRNPKMWPLDR